MTKITKLFMCMFFAFVTAILGVQFCVFAESFDGYIVKFVNPPVMTLSDNVLIEAVVPDNNVFKVSTNDSDYISYLESDPNVEFIEPNYIIPAHDDEVVYLNNDTEEAVSEDLNSRSGLGFETPNDFGYKNQWNMPLINAPYLWKCGISADSVKIGVIDSGNPSKHPDVTFNIETGRDYTDTNVYDIFGHGTFVSGVIASNINNYMGTAGILNDCTIIPLKIFRNSATDSDTLKLYRAIYDAVHVYNCDVINLSLSMTTPIESIKSVIDDALANGTIVVAAAGNHKDSGILYPAGYDGVIGVAAVGKNKVRYVNSQRNESVDVSAPGASVYGAYVQKADYGSNKALNYTYVYGNGTSYAAPHVTAAAAIAKKFNPKITSDEFLKILAQTSETLGEVDSSGKNIDYGYGLLDIQKIVELMETEASPSPTRRPGGSSGTEPTEEPSTEPSSEPSVYLSSFEPRVVIDANFRVTNISAKVSVKNNMPNTKVKVIMALYDKSPDLADELSFSDRFCDAVVLSGEIVKNSSSSFTLSSIDIPTDCENPYVKVFLWDENLSPLIMPYDYIIQTYSVDYGQSK